MGKYNKYRKKTKYKRVAFKLTQKQKQRLDDFCEGSGGTPIKTIKYAIMDYIERNESIKPQPKSKVKIGKNQLSIFDLIDSSHDKKSTRDSTARQGIPGRV